MCGFHLGDVGGACIDIDIGGNVVWPLFVWWEVTLEVVCSIVRVLCVSGSRVGWWEEGDTCVHLELSFGKMGGGGLLHVG